MLPSPFSYCDIMQAELRAYKKIVEEKESRELALSSATMTQKVKKKKKDSSPSPAALKASHRSPPPPPREVERSTTSSSVSAVAVSFSSPSRVHANLSPAPLPPEEVAPASVPNSPSHHLVSLRTEIERVHHSAIPIPPNSHPLSLPEPSADHAKSPVAKIFNQMNQTRGSSPSTPSGTSPGASQVNCEVGLSRSQSPEVEVEPKEKDLDALERTLFSTDNAHFSSWMDRYSFSSQPQIKSPVRPHSLNYFSSPLDSTKYPTPHSINEIYRDSSEELKGVEASRFGRSTMIYSKQEFGIFGAPVPLPDRDIRQSLSPGTGTTYHSHTSSTPPTERQEHPLRQALRCKSPQLALRRSGDNSGPLSGPVYNSPDPQSPPGINSRAFSKESLRLPPSQRYQEAMTVASIAKAKRGIRAPSGAMRTPNEWK